MRRFGLALGLVLVFAAAVVAGTSVTASAQLPINPTPILFTYSFLGVDSTMNAACNDALATLEAACPIHGGVTYDRGRCITTYPPFLDPVTLCDCKAQTHLCLKNFPF